MGQHTLLVAAAAQQQQQHTQTDKIASHRFAFGDADCPSDTRTHKLRVLSVRHKDTQTPHAVAVHAYGQVRVHGQVDVVIRL